MIKKLLFLMLSVSVISCSNMGSRNNLTKDDLKRMDRDFEEYLATFADLEKEMMEKREQNTSMYRRMKESYKDYENQNELTSCKRYAFTKDQNLRRRVLDEVKIKNMLKENQLNYLSAKHFDNQKIQDHYRVNSKKLVSDNPFDEFYFFQALSCSLKNDRWSNNDRSRGLNLLRDYLSFYSEFKYPSVLELRLVTELAGSACSFRHLKRNDCRQFKDLIYYQKTKTDATKEYAREMEQFYPDPLSHTEQLRSDCRNNHPFCEQAVAKDFQVRLRQLL